MPYPREIQNAYVLTRNQARRRLMFEQRTNLNCTYCGLPLESLETCELHHRDPKQKISHRIWANRWEFIRAECAKCDWLHTACHRKLHADLMRLPDVHGTDRTYRRGCRCQACKIAHHHGPQAAADYLAMPLAAD